MSNLTSTSPNNQPHFCDVDPAPPPPDAAVRCEWLRTDPVFVAFTTLAARIVATFDGAERVGWLDALDKAMARGTAEGQMREIVALARAVSDVV